MGLFNLFFGTNESRKEIRKRVFISFAVEDIEYRDHLVNQARNNRSPFDFVDMSVKKTWQKSEWQKRCRTKIKRCDGVIALLSKNTYHAGGARWEMKCAIEENVEIIGMHIRKNDKGAIPPELKGEKIIEWNWSNLEKFVNQLKKYDKS
ncbi:hypothetical protein SDC9_40313 [bioreactor metagenome]|uniref:Thoeris protein ThsB TIR-like domain-containing protein n=1 Tax=bioreactor metagenome TaxID=1076179 RepID=A0A644VRZ0_9ZZZZ